MVIIDGYQVATNKIPTNNNNDTMITVPPKPYREFEANVIILHHQTTIGCGYEPVIHCGVLRQAAVMIHIQGNNLSYYLTHACIYIHIYIYIMHTHT